MMGYAWSIDRIEHMKYILNLSLRILVFGFSRIVIPNYAELHPHGTINKYKTDKVDHWSTIIPFSIFQEFFDVTPEWIISNSYCDVRLCHYTRCYNEGAVTQTITIPSEHPLYLYRIHDDGQCINPHKINHRHAKSLRTIVDTNRMGTDINSLSVNLEITIIKYYPDMQSIKESLMSHFISWPEESKLISCNYINSLWPSITQWIHQTYAI